MELVICVNSLIENNSNNKNRRKKHELELTESMRDEKILLHLRLRADLSTAEVLCQGQSWSAVQLRGCASGIIVQHHTDFGAYVPEADIS